MCGRRGEIRTGYWLCVTNPSNWWVVKNRKVWGVSRHHQHFFERIKLGDSLVFYVTRAKIAGIFKVASEPFESNERIFSSIGFAESERFPYRVKLDAVVIPKNRLPIVRLVPELSFITNKKKWFAHFRRAMVAIPREDYEKIKLSLERRLSGEHT